MKKRIVLFFLSIALICCIVSPVGHAAQPNMEKALASLRQAESYLKQASHNKGGHRAKALELVQRAIKQVKAGIKAGEK